MLIKAKSLVADRSVYQPPDWAIPSGIPVEQRDPATSRRSWIHCCHWKEFRIRRTRQVRFGKLLWLLRRPLVAAPL
jgi:hypothetical protein